jgi:hypothetical protein
MSNILAYYDSELIIAVKSFIVQPVGQKDRAFMPVIITAVL